MAHLAGRVGPHRNLADHPVTDVALLRKRLLVDALDFAALENTFELFLEHVTRLARQNVKYIFTQHGAARDTKLAEFAIAVPRDDAVLASDRVQRKRQTVDDRFDKPFLRFAFSGTSFDFSREAQRRLARGLIERADVRRK